jgi:Fur family zinc uptake transcriptional regulator
MSDTAPALHDHAACIADAIASAEDHCDQQKLQFTQIRRRVFEILLNEHKAIGAYDILAQLGGEGFRSQPPVAYRALDFLVSNGFVHKVEGRNAYVACAHPGQSHAPVLIVCRLCAEVQEADLLAPVDFLTSAAKASGFKLEKLVVEAEGICRNCQGSQA